MKRVESTDGAALPSSLSVAQRYPGFVPGRKGGRLECGRYDQCLNEWLETHIDGPAHCPTGCAGYCSPPREIVETRKPERQWVGW
jgi:hypothetical protein